MEKLLSIIFSVLLITGTMAPAVMAAEPSTTPLSSDPGERVQGERVQFDSTRSASSPTEDVSTNRSALDLRDRALDTLENSPRSRGEKAPTEDLRSTYRYVLDDRRVNSSRIFDTDRTIVARTQRHQPSVAADLATADHSLARTAVDDADRVSAMLDERGIEYDDEAVAESIAEAAVDLEKADRLRSDGQLVAAVVHSEKAWVNAQEALAEMDAAVEPVVTITYREDPPHEGRFNYTLEGTVFDVHTLNHEAKGTVNENDRYLPLNTSTVPGEVATFNETVQLDDRANVVTVTVTNPPDEYVEIDAKGRPDHARGNGGAKADSKRGDGKRNSNDPREKSDRSARGGSGGSLTDEPQIGTDTLRLDGDGLPDRYETETTGTDRLDPDSNSTFTDRNESGIGALDGMKDLDVDGLTNYEEHLIGTEPLENDTDGDGLLDGWEAHVAGTDPLDGDSFDDGVSDGDRDLGGGGLVLLDDQEHGTNPRVRDTDRDELTDYEEIHVYDTDPLDPDTSGDGLFDGEKVRLDLDPAANDTAPDGTPASERTYTTSTTNESSGVTVAGTGSGVVADGIHVRDETATGSVNGSVGPTVRVTNTTDFDHATVTIPIQEPIDGENLTVVKWDPTTDASWRAVETEIDAANRTASANVTSFSYFTVATDSFGSAFSETIQPRWPTLDDFRSVRNWDTSGSVSHDAGIVTLESAFPEGERDDGDDSDGNDDDDYDPCKDPRILGSDVGIQKCHDDGGNDDDEGDEDYDPCEDPRILGSDVGIQKCHDDDDEDDQPDDPRILDAGGESTASTTDAALPNSSRISRTLTVEPGAKNARLEARIASSTPEKTSFVNAYVEGESGTKAVYEKSGGQVGVRSGSTWQRVRADLSQFEGEDVTVHFETTNDAKLRVDYVGVLADSAGNGIPDTVEEMDLRMPAGQPGVVGTPLELDPRRADTDGDGLRDDEEVDIEWGYTESGDGLWALEATVEDTTAHPARIDTTGDGLSDRYQTEGWEIHVVDTHAKATELMEVVADPDDDRPLSQVFAPREVTANPLVDDTDGDGMSDADELELGTDPRQEDSTGDGISDRRALSLDTEDPTVFTTTPPTVTLDWYHQRSVANLNDGITWEFTYLYRIEDEVGIDTYKLYRNGDEWDSGSLNRSNGAVVETRFTSLIEGTLTTWRGSQANVEVTDVHGNTNTQRIHSQTAFYGTLAEHGLDPVDAGMLSGFTHSAAELPEMVVIIGEDPVGVSYALWDFARSIDSAVVREMIAQMPESIRDQQRLDNPFPESDHRHDQYAEGWYRGYTVHFVASMAYGGTITKGISKEAGLSARLQKAKRGLGDVTPALRTGKGFKTARIQKAMADGGVDIPADVRLLTAGKRATTIDRYLKIRPVIRNSLSASQRTELLQYLADASNGHRVINNLGPQRTEQLFKFSFDNVDNGQFRANIIQHGAVISQQRLNRYIDDVSAARSQGTIHNPEGLVSEAASEGIAPSQIRGQAGEARSVVRYTDEGADVTVEPGRGDYDLAATRDSRTEYVEVKTRAPDKNVDYNYLDGKIDDMNTKYDNALSDSDLDVASNDRVLEIRTNTNAADLEPARLEVQRVVDDRLRIAVDEIRLVAEDGAIETISINS